MHEINSGSPMKIFSPNKFDRDTLLPFFLELDQLRMEPTVTIDFSPLTFTKPTATLVAGAKLREWLNYRISNSLSTQAEGISEKNSGHTYLMHVGFFDYVGFQIGKRIGEAFGNNNYLPITKIPIPALNARTHNIKAWHDEIQEEASSLARVLVKDSQQTEEIRTYSYCLRELIRNVFEHSNATECFIFGQKWANGDAEIAVVDAGQGIRASLSPVYPVETDAMALELALLPGVSRTRNLPQDENVYDNSGFGLYVLSSVAASFGWFAFGSHSSRVIGYNNTQIQRQEFSFPGTFFGMRLKSSPKNFQSVLNDVIQAGEEESGAQGAAQRASGLSRLA